MWHSFWVYGKEVHTLFVFYEWIENQRFNNEPENSSKENCYSGEDFGGVERYKFDYYV